MNKSLVQTLRKVSLPVALQMALLPLFAGESTPEQPTEVIALRLEVQSDGEPLRGLTAESFRVRDKGREAPIADLIEVDLEMEGGRIPEAAGRLLLFLFDLELTEPVLVVRATDLAQELLSGSLLPSDRVVIATHEASSGLRVELNPTAERQEITEALDSLREEEARRVSGGSLAAGPLVTGDDLVTSRARGTESAKGIVQTEQGRILGLVRSLSMLERLARFMPGNSQVVLFSEGFDSSVILGNQATQRLDQASLTAQSEASARGQVSAVNSAGRYGGGVVETAFFEMLSCYKRLGVPIQAIRLESAADIPGVERGARGPNGLVLMAEKTGGQMIPATGDAVRQMRDTLAPVGATYVLTFEPRFSKPEGRYRRVDVKLENPVGDTRLIFPPGYYEPSPAG